MKCIQADFRSAFILSLENLMSEKEIILGNNVCERHLVARLIWENTLIKILTVTDYIIPVSRIVTQIQTDINKCIDTFIFSESGFL